MKTNELRIGNYIFYNKEVIQVTGIEINHIHFGNDNFDSNTGSYKPFEPIPITEYWLKKLRFKKRVFKYSDKGKTHIEYSKYHKSLNLASIEYINEEKCCYLDFEGTQTGQDIKYVHQLQNLYFILTGTELTLK